MAISQEQIDAFYSMWRKIDILYEEYAKTLGLSYTSMKVLYCIYKGQGGCTQKQICEESLLPKQTVHSVVNGFLKGELVFLRACHGDRRSKAICLSDRGAEFCRNAFEKLERAELRTMEHFSAEDCGTLVGLLTQYASAFEKEIND